MRRLFLIVVGEISDNHKKIGFRENMSLSARHGNEEYPEDTFSGN
jgi:hypothetical protein